MSVKLPKKERLDPTKTVFEKNRYGSPGRQVPPNTPAWQTLGPATSTESTRPMAAR